MASPIGDEVAIFKTLYTQALLGPIPEDRIYLPGMAHPSLDASTEWIQFNVLNSEGLPSRVIDYKSSFFLEIIIYVLHVGFRERKNLYRYRELVQIYKDLFNQKRFDADGTCLQFREGRIMYLDLNSLGDFASNIRQRSPSANVNSVDLLWQVDIFESRLP